MPQSRPLRLMSPIPCHTGDESSARSIAADVAGGEPHVSIAHDGQSTSVTVECSVLPGPLDVTPTRVTGNATAISQ